MDIQTATNIVAYAERDKLINIDSKVRAVTRKASFKASVDAMTDRLTNNIHRSRSTVPETYTTGVYGPKQNIKVWRKQ